MIKRSIELATENVAKGGEPFGAVLTCGEDVLTEAVNEAYIHDDPTAHAEMQALRQAGNTLRQPHEGITMYASGKPCGMCMAAMLQVGIDRVVYGADEKLGAAYGWGTQPLYDKLKKDLGEQGIEIVNCPDASSKAPFDAYKEKHGA